MINPQISIIVPVYKTAPYLRRCLDSLINQTFPGIEIICINDASPDNALEIIGMYAQCDNRIKLINFAKNRGVSFARNSGMAAASGEYIGFVDSDDDVDLNFFAYLYKEACATGADIVKGNKRTLQHDKPIVETDNKHIKQNKFYFLDSFTTAIYKRIFLNSFEIEFPEGVLRGQDIVFSTKAMIHANIVATVDDVFYNHHRSGAGDRLNIKQIHSVIDACHMIIEYANNTILTKESYLILLYFQCNILNNLSMQIEDNKCCQAYFMIGSGLIGLIEKSKYQNALLDEYVFSIKGAMVDNNIDSLVCIYEKFRIRLFMSLMRIRIKDRSTI